MDRISGLNKIVESLRLQISKKQSSRISSVKRKTPGIGKVERKPRRISSEQLQKRIIDRIKVLDKNDESFQFQATSIIIESVLIWEFGDNLSSNPKFYEMVSDINNSMLSDKPTSLKLNKLFGDIVGE